jgi:hypothetical protein
MEKLRIEIDALEASKTELNKELKILKAETVEHLDAHELRRFDGSTHMVYITEKHGLKIEDRHAFFEFLKSKGVFEDTVNVASTKLGGIYEQELEIAKEHNDLAFLRNGIPGLSEPRTHRTINFRSIKK